MKCPVCRSEDVRVGWPIGQAEAGRFTCPLIVPVTCKKCGHEWKMNYLPPPTEGERADREEART